MLSPKAPEQSRTKKVLLSSVFGPYGVDNAYGRKENIMELFHNQVTKGQGIGSWRFHHRSYGLYLLAANIKADVTVLDFPSYKRFIRELKKGYDIVGISFITPNFLKAQEMARLVRKLAPKSTIVLGGHGAAIEGVKQLIDCDHVIKGEGIGPLRSLLGQNPGAPIAHPALPSVERMSAFGVPFPGVGPILLVTGVGCVNGCKFCATSHFFDRRYTHYISTGKQLFNAASKISDEMGNDEFFIMDENFLKDRQRADELLAEMEKHQRYFRFLMFSSAEAIHGFGIDNLVRLGVSLIWIGVEASGTEGNFEKNRGVDARELIQQLRSRGIAALASGILCQEHHTQQTIQKDIDFMVGLEADLVQFMLLTPLPVTALYEDHNKRGLLRWDLPFEEWHGQKYLSYNHPEFPGDSAEKWVQAAFRQDYEVNSSSMYRFAETALRGYLYLSSISRRDACLELRWRQAREKAILYGSMLPVVAKYAINEIERKRAIALDQEMVNAFGKPGAGQKLRRAIIPLLTMRWKLRCLLRGDVIQPQTIVTKFKAHPDKVASISNKMGACPVVNESLAYKS